MLTLPADGDTPDVAVECNGFTVVGSSGLMFRLPCLLLMAGSMRPRPGAFYYGTFLNSLEEDGDVFRVLDALKKSVGVVGVFSDWPATTTFYDNCYEHRMRRKD